ncbi:hypothetical protein MUK42_32131 [Musa troglodytarum]|uniref:ER lumen protein-retaining receptor n=1 Tax=Musa troglodytarum TaxID=320322 RepID=A0A9E7FHT2_9LILI|nr:hypothetical protein MUK42_32131 [Musa troglodytarum]
MNAFRFAGDMSHLFSVLVLLLKIYATKSCSGISLKTQELYALVFLTRYLDLFTYVVSVYNTLMKIVFISSSIAIVWCMRFHPVVRRTYDKEQDTFRHYLLVGVCLVLALLFHERFTIREVFWVFSIFLEAVAILPQLILLQRSRNVDNLTSQYVLFLGILIFIDTYSSSTILFLFLRAYRAFYILNWIYRYVTEDNYSAWIAWIAGVVQTGLYADFFYYYFISWKNNAKLQLLLEPGAKQIIQSCYFKGWTMIHYHTVILMPLEIVKLLLFYCFCHLSKHSAQKLTDH